MKKVFLVLLFGWMTLGVGCSGDHRKTSRDTIVVIPQEPLELDPRFCGDAYGIKVSRLLFASLVTIDPHSLDVTPDLAERVDIVSPTMYRVVLARNLRFSDGSALDANDVIATYRSIQSPSMQSRYRGTYTRIRTMTARNPYEVDFELSEPHGSFLMDLEMPILRAEDEHTHLTHQWTGAGPYVLMARSRGSLELRANPHWYRGTPRFASLRMIVIRDDNTRAMRLLAGRADLSLHALPSPLVPLFEHNSHFKVRSVPSADVTYLGVNTESPLLNDARVRRAIAHAIDRRTLIATKYNGHARLARGWIPPGHWAFREDVPVYPYNPTHAKTLLAEANVFKSSQRTLSIVCSADRFQQSIARAIASMLSQTGLIVNVRPMEKESMLADLNKGRFDIALLQVSVFEPNLLRLFFASDQIPNGAITEGKNRWRYRSAAMDRALEQGRVGTTHAERQAGYYEAQTIMAEDLPVIPLWHEDVVAVQSERLHEYSVPRDARFSTLAWSSR